MISEFSKLRITQFYIYSVVLSHFTLKFYEKKIILLSQFRVKNLKMVYFASSRMKHIDVFQS